MSEPFVSRAGRKIEHALETFAMDVTGLTCADFGCNVGGFTDCLLQRGAALVHAIDTGYGTLAWKLRQDERVVVMERTNALHATPPDTPVDLVTIDLAWTRQRHGIPAAMAWLGPGGRIISLVKPHYEVEKDEQDLLTDGALDPADSERICDRVMTEIAAFGLEVLDHTRSPITGGKSSRKRKGAGNVEYLVSARMPAV